MRLFSNDLNKTHDRHHKTNNQTTVLLSKFSAPKNSYQRSARFINGLYNCKNESVVAGVAGFRDKNRKML